MNAREREELRQAEAKVRRAYVRVAEQIEREFHGAGDDYSLGLLEAARRIWSAEATTADPDSPIAALTSADREWLRDVGWDGTARPV